MSSAQTFVYKLVSAIMWGFFFTLLGFKHGICRNRSWKQRSSLCVHTWLDLLAFGMIHVTLGSPRACFSHKTVPDLQASTTESVITLFVEDFFPCYMYFKKKGRKQPTDKYYNIRSIPWWHESASHETLKPEMEATGRQKNLLPDI